MKSEASAAVLVENVRAEISRRKQTLAQLHVQGDAAAAKLTYLLGMPPETVLQPTDRSPKPIDLVDATQDVNDLVNRAVANGPGIHELEGLMGVAHSGLELLDSPLHCLLVFQTGHGDEEGGTASSHFVSTKEKRRLLESKIQQLHFAYDELRGKLAAGTKEARDAILTGRDQINDATEQIRHAGKAYKLSDLRLREAVQGSSVAEVLLSIINLERAHLGYVSAVSAYNKAEVRLMLLLGPCAVQNK
jgi:outer membrane protein TolC